MLAASPSSRHATASHIVPLAILVVGFGTKAVNDAGVIVDGALPAAG